MIKNKSINLLPQEEFDASVMGKVLKWAMGSFRIIVVLTEMVVMAAFLSRFWFDAQNSDLNSSIKIASDQILAQQDFEAEFRTVQQKIDIFKQLTPSPGPSAYIDILASKIPQDLALSSIDVKNNQAQIKGTTVDELGIFQFISNLKTDPTIKKVDLGSVSSSESNQSLITFNINLTF